MNMVVDANRKSPFGDFTTPVSRFNHHMSRTLVNLSSLKSAKI
jgi:hypothetical protein